MTLVYIEGHNHFGFIFNDFGLRWRSQSLEVNEVAQTFVMVDSRREMTAK